MDDSATVPLLGVIGHPIAGNPMQFAMEQALLAAGLEWRFLSFDVLPEALADALRGVDALGFQGLSIAPPHGASVASWIGRCSPLCAITGWVDVLSRNDDGAMTAHHALADALLALIGADRFAGTQVAVLGNTEKTIALARAVRSQSIDRIWVRDLDASALDSPANIVNESDSPPKVRRDLLDDPDVLGEVGVVLRGPLRQPAGSKSPGESPAPLSEQQIEALPPDCFVVDLAVSASTSPPLRFAAQRGLPTLSSIDLLVERAALAFQWWTGCPADRQRLREAFEEFLEI